MSGGTLDELLVSSPERDNLECIDNKHFIHHWGRSNDRIFQFNNDGDLYFPGSLPHSGETVVYRRSRDGETIDEVINANICVQDYLITGMGGVFYTGQTCSSDNGGGGGFFRYVEPGTGGQILEIARDWWNFIYDTAVTETSNNNNETETTDSEVVDTAVFFGPDPRNATTASWETACLFNFNPSETDPTSRISEVITCADGHGIWNWLELRRSVDVEAYGEGYHNYTGNDSSFSPSVAWKKEYRRRCESKEEVFAGGGSQISAIKQTSKGEIYVIGNIRKKNEGALSCSVEFQGPHCTLDGIPTLLDSSDAAYSKTTCEADSGLWVNKGRCSNGSNDASCIEHSRSWNPGFCSNNDYNNQTDCEAAIGCTADWYYDQTDCQNAGYVWGNHVWQTGRCSSDPHVYRTQSACETASKTWEVDSWSGSCTSTDDEDNASLYNNDINSCIPEWHTEHVRYDNVKTDLCVAAETGDRSSWWDWDHADNNFAQTAVTNSKSAYTDLAARFLVDRFECGMVNDSGGNWTTEYSALAKVNSDTKSLELLSLESEKAIDLWLINDLPFYSSYDASLGKYLLNGVSTITGVCIDSDKTAESSCTGDDLAWTHRRCVNSAYTTKETCEDEGMYWQIQHPSTVLSNFETYNLAEGMSAKEMFIDGLDFTNNQYKFGSLNTESGELSLKKGLTGALKTVIILSE